MRLKACVDDVIEASQHKLAGAEDCVHHRARNARSVRDEACAVDAEERRAAVLVVIVLRVNRLHDRLESHREFGIGFKHLLGNCLEQAFRKTFCEFDHHVADDAVGDDDIRFAVKDAATFDVSNEIEPFGATKKIARDLHFSSAFLLFATDVHHCNARILDAEHAARVGVTHDAVLSKVNGLWFDVRANIDENDRACKRRNSDRDARTNDVRETTHVHLARCHASTSISCGNPRIDAIWVTWARVLRRARNRTVALRSNCFNRRVIHLDDFAAVNHFDLGAGTALRDAAILDRFFNDVALAEQDKGVLGRELRQRGE